MAAREFADPSAGVRFKRGAASGSAPSSFSIDLWRPLACCQVEKANEEFYTTRPEDWEEPEFDLDEIEQSLGEFCHVQEGVTCSDVLVIVDRSNGDNLGIEVTLLDNGVLLMEAIHAGLVDDWNVANASQRVKVGDTIVAVNGSRVSNKMLSNCKRKQVLYLLVRRNQNPSEDVLEFNITLDRTDGTRLGIDVDHQDGVQLVIEEIESGLVEEWNAKHPDQIVSEGDCIIEVNGVRGDVPNMLETCMRKGVLELKIRRGHQ